jgi:hypothetical protein
MFLEDLNTPAQRFAKIQSYLRENYNCEIASDALTYSKVNKLISEAKEKLSKLDEKKDAKEYAKLQIISEGLKLWKLAPVQTELTMPALSEALDDSNMEEAKVIIAAEEMTDKLQKMIEDLAEMQVQQLIPIIDAMKAEIGTDQANQFNEIVDSALGELLDIAKSTKDKLTSAIQVASGQQPSNDMANMGDQELDAGLPADIELDAPEDEFAGDDAMSGDFGPEGRKMKGESIDYMAALSEVKSATKNGKVSKVTLENLINKLKK